MSFEAFYNAIIGQESGGNYSAVNKDSGALGIAQIMPFNIGPWSKEILGYEITPQQFLNSPELQDAIVKGKLKKYYDSYGARGAASAWYSGQPDLHMSTKSQNGYPSIKDYVDSVVGRMGDGNQYGYVSEKTTDNRVQQKPLNELLGNQDTTKLDALSGADRNGLGLGEITTPGLQAATGGAGMMAATGPQAPQGGTQERAAIGQEFQERWDAAGEMAQAGDVEGVRAAVIDMAKQSVGTPYVWGGSGPGGFDCSGLIQYAMKQAGISFPRVSWDQINAGTRVQDKSKLKPGDLVGFGDGGHIAIWLGDNQILEAPRTGLDVRVRELNPNSSWDNNTYGISLDDWYK